MKLFIVALLVSVVSILCFISGSKRLQRCNIFSIFKTIFIRYFLFTLKASAEYVIKTGEDLNKARKECVLELGVPATTVAEFKKGIFTQEGVTPCYIQCVFSRLGLFDTTSGFITDNYLKQLGKGDSFKEGVVGCFDNSGSDTCIWAYKAFTCFKKGGFLPEGY